jgi:Cft2 family RNA processing exonuclease
MLCLLEDFWASEQLPYPLVFVSPLGDVILDQAKTRMEWLSEGVLRQFNDSANFTYNPFLFRHIQLCTSAEDFLEKFPGKAAKVVLASSSSLEVGDSRELFFRFAGDPSALVVLTTRNSTVKGSLLMSRSGQIALIF